MPFDFKCYDAKCAKMYKDELQREWQHYTRLISGAATSTAVSGAAIPATLGVSAIGVGLAAPALHNARKKRDIINRHLQRVGASHHTRKRDVLHPMAVSGTIGVVTLGISYVGADVIVNHAAEHGISYIVENDLAVKAATHLVCDSIAMVGEEVHMKSEKEQESWKAYIQLVQQDKFPHPPPSVDCECPAPRTPPLVGGLEVDNTLRNYDMPPIKGSVPPPPSYSEPVLSYNESCFSAHSGQIAPFNPVCSPQSEYLSASQYNFGSASSLPIPIHQAAGAEHCRIKNTRVM